MSDTPSWPGSDVPGGDPAPQTPPPEAPAPAPAAEPAATTTPPPPAPTASVPPPPPPPPPAPMAPAVATAAGTAGATLGLRFAARLIDGLLVGAVTSVFFGVSRSVVETVLSAVIILGYYVAMESTRGATVGKLVLGLSVAGADGEFPDPEASLKRNAFVALQIVPFIGGIAGLAAAIYIAVTINSAPDNRGFHDDMAGTTVTKA